MNRREIFEQKTTCKTYDLAPDTDLKLFENGFIADKAGIWTDILHHGSNPYSGHNIAIVSRTSASIYDILEPPKGLSCTFVFNSWLPGDDNTKAIATFITGTGEGALAFIQACRCLPANILGFALPDYLDNQGYYLALGPKDVTTDFEIGIMRHD